MHPNPTHRLVAAAAAVLTALASRDSLAEDPAPARPNIIVILSDDQGWGDLGVNGNRDLSTPSIDSLARDGASFDRFYVCPVCSPTRAEFLTGRYHPRGGVFGTSRGGERLDADERTIAEALRDAGYLTAAFGKWHNGTQHPYHPNARGFEEFYGFCSGHWGNYFDPMLEHNGQVVKGSGFVIDDFTERAMAFIEKHRSQPFFVYLPYNTPHSPMQVPDRWWDRFESKPLTMAVREPKKQNIGHTRAALAMCENIDWNVGRLLDKLDELDLAKNTVIAYFCDNGPNGERFNGNMKGRKGSTDEGGVRSPLFIRWPNRIPAGRRVERISAAIDLLPTLLDLADVKTNHPNPLDGVSLRPLLLDPKDTPWPDRHIFSHWNHRVSLRTDRFRLDHRGALFDMLVDPGQHRDVAKNHVAVVEELRESVATWRRTVLAELDRAPRAFPVGAPGSTNTWLPARDAVTSGGIERSNKFPNCSHFRNWRSTEDTVTWDIEVAAAGDFDVDLFYACPANDVGSTVELSHGKQRLFARIETPHEAPLRGATEDRVPRMESYVKNFRPMRLGTLALPAGRGQLKLRATEIPGDQVMELRMLLFTRRSDARDGPADL